jgi:hypothetical protein
MSGLVDAVEAMAAALAPIGDTVEGLQILPYMNPNPTPPSIDIYPATPFQDRLGRDDAAVFLTVRARTTFADHIAGQRGLYRMLDPTGPESVQAHLEADQTLGGAVQSLGVEPEGVSGFTEYVEDAQSGGRLVGCEWRVRVLTNPEVAT